MSSLIHRPPLATRRATAPRRQAGLLLAIPALLALLLAVALPQQRAVWLALLLFAALFASLAAPLWPRPQPRIRQPHAVRRRRLLVLTLLFLALLLSPLPPLPLGLLLLFAARQGLLLCHRPAPGFPLLDAVLLFAAVLAFLPAT